LFVKNFLIPIWTNYQNQKKQNKIYHKYVPNVMRSEDLTSEEGNVEWKGTSKQLNSYPFQEIGKISNSSNIFQNDFEYVDNLFQEVQYLINYKELSKVKEKKEENQISSQYFDADKISVLSMKNGIQNPY
jgi:hypothetical protein